ncbi:response regulator transcription factor [Bacteroidota bacterium]
MIKLPKILVVDDEEDLREILEFNLANEGFVIETASSGEEALDLELSEYDLILLDVMMGGISGYKVADIIRKERNIQVPIIFLTAKSDENDLLTGFNVGGDDYIVKPFSLKEVVVRINAILKRSDQGSKKKSPFKYKGLKLDTEKKKITMDKKDVDLTRKEYEVLYLLMRNKGNYISREDILLHVWGNEVIVTDRNVDVTITRLRKKIGKYSRQIKGKTGYGYLFDD